MGSYRMCLFFTRKFRVTEAGPADDVREAFDKYAEGGAYMSPEQLRRFLSEGQGESCGGAEEEKIVDEVLRRRHHIAKFTRRSLTLDDFNYFIFSTELNPPIGDQVHHDMKAPLSHYFIYTGHNSYLTGNQLSSNCSDLPVVKALRRGVRVVELDLWPRGKDDVCVKHGRTLTKPVKLGKCLESIKAHSFATSKYPVIITLEDHLTPRLQSKVAKMITQTFGDMLYYHDPESSEEFPSPEELKGKILISTKPPKEYLEANDAKEKDNGEKGKDSDEDVWGKEPSELTSTQSDIEKVSNNITETNQDDEDKEVCEFEMSGPLTAPEYRRLIAIHAGKPKGGLRKALKFDPNRIRRLSLSEQSLEKAVASYGTDVNRFTQKNFLRIYPKGTRFNSSNYKPQIGWMHGAQMIAFNMQGYGRALWLMHGMFRANGGCGYVKKPDFLMKAGPSGEVFDSTVKKTLKVKVCMGDGWQVDFKLTHFDLYSPPDFYVKVGIAGAPADEVMAKTKIKFNNWTPVWNEEFTFPLTAPELALLRVEVHEYDTSEKDDFGGQTCLPVSELRQGLRAVPLFDQKGEKYSSTRLLLRFEFV
ncbi:PREDICTED: phosphoinositide phospholipase C 4 [Tarenaya hassleriana]|uniref:phosphoinositide phospholipase C 4 n=1 Tax=Tarenaya hassleriana TaxID=28532 RepID=UPI00053C235D|nr:PREDICTED: phosphoinositide phospholipase C 4 [Tarenaya hassleriana]